MAEKRTEAKQPEEKKAVLPPKSDFSEWYNELLMMGEIMDVRYPVKGLYVWFPFGFEVRNRTYAIIRELLDKDHKEALFPLLIPETEFMKEAEHIKGFENEVYWVTRGARTNLMSNLRCARRAKRRYIRCTRYGCAPMQTCRSKYTR